MNKGIIFILLTTFLFTQEASVTNVTVEQRHDGSKIVDIYYDLTGDLVFPSFDVRVYVNNSKDNNCIYAYDTISASDTWLCGYNDGNVLDFDDLGTYSCECENPNYESTGGCYSVDCESFNNGGATPPSLNGLQNPSREFLCTTFNDDEYCQVSFLSGDVYQNVQPGTSKHIAWDLSIAYSNIELDNMNIKIMATGHEVVENFPFQVATIPAGSYYSVQSNQTETISYNYEIMLKEVTNAEYAQFLISTLGEGLISVNVCGYDDEEVTDFFGNFQVANSCSDCPEDIATEYCNEDPFSVNGNVSYGNEYLSSTLNPPYLFFDHLNTELSAGDGNKIIFNGTTFIVDEGYGNHPVTNVTWEGADAFAKFYGMRLPNREEWERAAVGESSSFGQFWPWGDELMGHDDQGNLIDLIAANFSQECESCMEESWNDGFDGTSPVGFYNGTNTFPGTDIPTSDGRSSYGLYDMAGNVSEYLYEFEYDEDQNIPLLIGGGWNINITELATDNGVSTMHPQFSEEEFGIFGASGFRCVRTK